MRKLICKLLRCCYPNFGVEEALAEITRSIAPTEGVIVRDEGFKTAGVNNPPELHKSVVIFTIRGMIFSTDQPTLRLAVDKVLEAYRQQA